MDKAKNFLGNWDMVFIAHGALPSSQSNYEDIEKNIKVNFLSIISLLMPIIAEMKENQSGQIAVIGSVAGERGRKSNYIYGAAKGALALYLQGLRQGLFKDNIQITTIKPGFISTPMTETMKQGILFISAPKAGRLIHHSIEKRKEVAYIPGFWLLIMSIIRAIPEFLFKRTNI